MGPGVVPDGGSDRMNVDARSESESGSAASALTRSPDSSSLSCLRAILTSAFAMGRGGSRSNEALSVG